MRRLLSSAAAVWLSLAALAGAVENDPFAAAADLGSAGSFSLALDTTLATRQVGEPEHSGDASRGSVWWKWTAPTDGYWQLTFDESITSFDYRLAVYTGDALDDLAEAGASSGTGLTVPVAAGRQYFLALARNGWSKLEGALTLPPSNDDFSDREEIFVGDQLALEGSTVRATREDDEPAHGGSAAGAGSVWWEWTAPEDGILRTNLSGTDNPFWWVIFYEGDELATLGERSRWTPGRDRDQDLVLRVKGGERFAIAAARSSAGQEGEIRLNLAFEAVANNDDPSDAINLGSVSQVEFAGDTTGATPEDGLPFSRDTIWWKWTAPANGVATVRTISGPAGLDISLLREFADGTIEEVPTFSQPTRQVRADESYFIHVASSSWAPVTLELELEPAPQNDDFADALPLAMGVTSFDFGTAGPDPGQPVDPIGADAETLWWRWVAPADGALLVEKRTLSFSYRIDLYRGDELGTLELVTSPDSQGGGHWPVTAGETYHVVASPVIFWPSDESWEMEADFIPETTGNDTFADRADLGSGWTVRGFADFEAAASVPGEPNHPAATRWWTWTAPGDGVAYLSDHVWNNQTGGTFLRRTTVYQGPAIHSLGEPVFPIPFDLTPYFEVSAGEAYHFQVARSLTDADHLTDFELRVYPAPHLNDNYANATDLGAAGEHEETLTFAGATREAGEPQYDPDGFRTFDRTRWWKWTPDTDRNAMIELKGSGALVIGVYEGASPATATPLRVELTGGSSLSSAFPGFAGRTYHIVLGAGIQETVFALRTWDPPPGDRFDDPLDLGSADDLRLEGGLDGYTYEPGDPEPPLPFYPSRWWIWTAPAHGLFELKFAGPRRIFQGESLDALTEIMERAFYVEPGEELRISYQNDVLGTPILQFHARPSNDHFAHATDLGSTVSASDSVDWHASSLEPGEPVWTPDPGAGSNFHPGSVWWRWTAPDDGIMRVLAQHDSTQTDLTAVLRGTELGALEMVASDTDHYHELKVPVQAGESYHILAAGAAVRLGVETELTVELLDAPANNRWFRAEDLGNEESAAGNGNNTGAMVEGFEGDAAGFASVWWTWTAPREGTALLVADLAEIPGRSGVEGEIVRVYRPDGAGGLIVVPATPVATEGPGTGRAVPVAAGERIWFSVASEDAFEVGDIAVAVHLLDRPANDLAANAGVIPPGIPLVDSHAGALGESGDPDPFGIGVVPTLWWEWTAPAGGWHRLGVSSGEAVAYTGTPGAWVEVARTTGGVTAWEAVAGETYRILGVDVEARWEPVTVAIDPLVPAGNDAFADRLPLAGALPLAIDGETFTATAEPGEPAHGGQVAARSLWYEWTGTGEGVARWRVTGVPEAPGIAVYTGTELSGLTEVASGDGDVFFMPAAGTVYFIAVDPGAGPPGAFTLSVDMLPLPPNDRFADRLTASGERFALTGDRTLATKEDGEWRPGNWPYKTLWWEWVAPSNAYLRIEEAIGSSVIPVLFEGRTAAPGGVTDLRSLGPISNMSVRAGQRYYIQVGSYFPDSGGPFTLRLATTNATVPGESIVRPPNDDFADRISLGALPQVRSSLIDPFNATNEPGEPIGSFTRAVWWTWTAPFDGFYEVEASNNNASGTTFHTGDSLGTLVEVASGTGVFVFEAVAGTSYQIAVESRYFDDRFHRDRDGRVVGFDLRRVLGTPANDDFADREDLGSLVGVSTPGHNIFASAEAGEPEHGGVPAGASVWYAWTAPETGRFTLNAFGATMRAAVYTGGMVTGLTPVAGGIEPLEFEAVDGTSYAIALDAFPPDRFGIRIDPPEDGPPPPGDPPGNDDFSNATVLTGAAANDSATLADASLQAGEAQPGGASWSRSGWWSWTAPADGPVNITTSPSDYYKSVFTGDTLADLAPLISATGTVRFVATAGTTYRIAVTGTSSAGAYDIEIGMGPPGPANDHFADAEMIAGADVTIAGTTVDSSWEPGEPSHAIGSFICPQTVWYEWTCPQTAPYDIAHTAVGSTCLAVYTGATFRDLLPLGFDSRELRIHGEAGTTYRIAVAESGATGPFELSVRQVGQPGNDDFADRVALGPLLDTPVSGSTVEATREAGERFHANGFSPGGTVWWSWTAPADGVVFIDLGASERPNLAAVYIGDALGSLEVVAEGSKDVLEFEAVAGTVYQVVVSAAAATVSSAGAVELSFSMSRPANDRFVNRRVLPGGPLPVSTMLGTLGASVELGEGPHGGVTNYGTVWCEWTPEASGMVDIVWVAETAVTSAVYTGNSLPTLVPVATTVPGSQAIRIEAVAGTAYQIVVAPTSAGTAPAVRLDIIPSRPPPVNDDFADAIMVAGEELVSTGNNWGATAEPGEPTDHFNSLWWRWTAPRTGLVQARGGKIHFYQGDRVDQLASVPVVGDEFDQEFLVKAGEQYAIALNRSGSLSDITLTLEMGPKGDLFEDAVALPSDEWLTLHVELGDAGWEVLEPAHDGKSALRSVWHRWTAPYSGRFRLAEGSGIGSCRLAVYTGDAITRLNPVAEGESGLWFEAVAGREYHIVIDVLSPASPSSFEVTLRPDPPAYASWRDGFFGDGRDELSAPLQDPDGDGRPNIFEMGFGTHPLVPDMGPIEFTVTRRWGYIVLSLQRPIGVAGLRYSFDVGRRPGPWHWTGAMDTVQWTEARGDGTETLYVVLTQFSAAEEKRFFGRVRLDFGEDPADFR